MSKPSTDCLAGQAVPAAQWIILEGHVAWVWQRCHRDVDDNNWNLGYWIKWKLVFQNVVETVDGKNVHPVARQDAAKALDIMVRLKTSVMKEVGEQNI